MGSPSAPDADLACVEPGSGSVWQELSLHFSRIVWGKSSSQFSGFSTGSSGTSADGSSPTLLSRTSLTLSTGTCSLSSRGFSGRSTAREF